MTNDVRIKMLETKIRKTESKGYAISGCIRKWKREIRKLSV